MIAVDTNVLVFAHRSDSPFHDVALRRVTELARGRDAWAIPWPCVHEFLGVVTHPKIYRPPTPLPLALAAIDEWRKSPGLVLLGEEAAYWERFRSLAEVGRIAGGLVHDARVAAICLSNGVSELWTADRDFIRFPTLHVRNPLVPG